MCDLAIVFTTVQLPIVRRPVKASQNVGFQLIHVQFCFVFSPDELLAQNKKPSNLPLHGGPKAFAPDPNDDEDDKALKSMLQEQRDVLKEQRVHKK